MSYIYKQVNAVDLYHDLKAMDRNNFSYDGAKALMEYLEEVASDSNEPIEYDPIALCCDFAEYAEEEYAGLAEEHSEAPQQCDFENDDDHAEFNAALIEWLRENTTVIETSAGIIIQSF